MSISRVTIVMFLLAMINSSISSNDNIVTYEGRKIIINENYTWEYLNPDISNSSIKEIYPKNKNKVLINSSNLKYGVYIDNEKWTSTTGINDEAELQFKNFEDTAYAMLIFEGLEIPIESMKELIILNANNIDPNARILNSEKCAIGNIEGELVTYTARSAGLNFIFFTFISSNTKGTIQFICFTLDSEFDELKPEFVDLISGFKF